MMEKYLHRSWLWTKRDLDEVAYVRFASVYRQFTDINTVFTRLKSCDKQEGQ